MNDVERVMALVDEYVGFREWLVPDGGPTGRIAKARAALRAAVESLAAPAGDEWRKAVALAYGHLWHVNNEPAAPIPMRSPETAAYEARKALRELLTHEERGNAINEVGALIGRYTKDEDAARQRVQPASEEQPKQPDSFHLAAGDAERTDGSDGWRACAGCSTPNDCRMHGCGVTRGLWKPTPSACTAPAKNAECATGCVRALGVDVPDGGKR